MFNDHFNTYINIQIAKINTVNFENFKKELKQKLLAIGIAQEDDLHRDEVIALLFYYIYTPEISIADGHLFMLDKKTFFNEIENVYDQIARILKNLEPYLEKIDFFLKENKAYFLQHKDEVNKALQVLKTITAVDRDGDLVSKWRNHRNLNSNAKYFNNHMKCNFNDLNHQNFYLTGSAINFTDYNGGCMFEHKQKVLNNYNLNSNDSKHEISNEGISNISSIENAKPKTKESYIRLYAAEGPTNKTTSDNLTNNLILNEIPGVVAIGPNLEIRRDGKEQIKYHDYVSHNVMPTKTFFEKLSEKINIDLIEKYQLKAEELQASELKFFSITEIPSNFDKFLEKSLSVLLIKPECKAEEFNKNLPIFGVQLWPWHDGKAGYPFKEIDWMFIYIFWESLITMPSSKSVFKNLAAHCDAGNNRTFILLAALYALVQSYPGTKSFLEVIKKIRADIKPTAENLTREQFLGILCVLNRLEHARVLLQKRCIKQKIALIEVNQVANNEVGKTGDIINDIKFIYNELKVLGIEFSVYSKKDSENTVLEYQFTINCNNYEHLAFLASLKNYFRAINFKHKEIDNYTFTSLDIAVNVLKDKAGMIVRNIEAKRLVELTEKLEKTLSKKSKSDYENNFAILTGDNSIDISIIRINKILNFLGIIFRIVTSWNESESEKYCCQFIFTKDADNFSTSQEFINLIKVALAAYFKFEFIDGVYQTALTISRLHELHDFFAKKIETNKSRLLKAAADGFFEPPSSLITPDILSRVEGKLHNLDCGFKICDIDFCLQILVYGVSFFTKSDNSSKFSEILLKELAVQNQEANYLKLNTLQLNLEKLEQLIDKVALAAEIKKPEDAWMKDQKLKNLEKQPLSNYKTTTLLQENSLFTQNSITSQFKEKLAFIQQKLKTNYAIDLQYNNVNNLEQFDYWFVFPQDCAEASAFTDLFIEELTVQLELEDSYTSSKIISLKQINLIDLESTIEAIEDNLREENAMDVDHGCGC
ncbi:MAG: hypothetical protein Tsb005_10990 [Gammaproteobacteria bacterium]